MYTFFVLIFGLKGACAKLYAFCNSGSSSAAGEPELILFHISTYRHQHQNHVQKNLGHEIHHDHQQQQQENLN